MTRPLRIQYENATYHVMNRGRGRQAIFQDSSYYQSFLQCLEEAGKRFAAEIQAYCLMSNHYHLLIKTPRGNLSRIMRHIDGVYTQRHNRLRHTDGSLFRGRYKAILIDSSSYLLQVSRYIHRNPIETKKPLVNHLADYAWSSYPAYINQSAAPAWLNRDAVYGEQGSRKRYQAYRTYVDQGNDHEIIRFYQQKRGVSILGSKQFAEALTNGQAHQDSEINQRETRPVVPILTIIRQVAQYYQIPEQAITQTRRGQGARNIPRWMAMKLCQQHGEARLVDLAKAFNVGHYSTVSQTIGRLNKLLLEEKEFATEFNVLSQDLMGWTRSI